MNAAKHVMGLLLIVSTALIVGCAGSSRDSAPLPSASPADFALGIVVYGDPESANSARRPARYIVEPDRMLRAGVGPGAAPRTVPPYAATLSPEVYQGLWELLAESGLPENQTDRLNSPENYRPIAGDAVALVYAAWDGRRRYWAVRLDDAPGTAALVERLAELAWVGG